MNILIVDDNRDTLRAYRKAILRSVSAASDERLAQNLSNQALEVEQSDTVSDAITKLNSTYYDILVVDLKIPGLSGEEMGGLDIITESLRLHRFRPIIVITGYGTIELARKAFTQGVFDFIEKGSDTTITNLVTSVREALQIKKEKLMRSGNPFTPMTGVEPSVFGGRISEVTFFEQRLDHLLKGNYAEHFLVLGNWGIGKSTLLKEFKKICRSRGYLATLVQLEPFQPGTKLIEVARSVVEGILRDLPFSVDRFKRISDFFATVGITVLGTGLQLSRDTTQPNISPQSFLFDSLHKLWEDVKDKSGVLVILLDDLDNLASVPEFVMTLKQTLSLEAFRSTKILIGISSTSANWSEITSVKKHHPLSRYFLSRFELEPLSKQELEETVTKSLEGTGVMFSNEIIPMIFEYTHGHPFEMQVVCYHLFSNQFSQRVSRESWEKAIESSLSDLGAAVFDYWYKEASQDEAKVLRAIAEYDSNVSIKEIQETLIKSNIKVSEKNIAKYLQRLVEKQLIERRGRGIYSITDKMFRFYLKFKIPLL